MREFKITEADGNYPIAMDGATKKQLSLAINSSDITMSFELPKSDPKAEFVNPNNPLTYSRLWECWDVSRNKRVHHGIITEVDDGPGTYTVHGAGMPQFLIDQIKTIKTFYLSLGEVVDSLRYENIAAQPQTSTIIGETTTNFAFPLDDYYIFGSMNANEKYYALSNSSRDYAIDDFDGMLLKAGELEPQNTAYTTNQHWVGQSPYDTIILDFGEIVPLNKIELNFPWWGGESGSNNRTFDFELAYATDDPALYSYKGRDFSDFTIIYTSPVGNRQSSSPGQPLNIYVGYQENGTSFNYRPIYAAQDVENVSARYIRINIFAVNAWYKENFKGTWSGANNYIIDDLVRKTHSTKDWYFRCIQNNINKSPTNGTSFTNTDYWTELGQGVTH
jgi:hypothetical protein